MPKYLDTSGNNPLSVFICPRCKMKRAYVEMVTDPNTGLKVCNRGCADLKDPYRLPTRKTEDISIRYPRPDEPLDASNIEDVVLEDGSHWITDEGEFVVVDDDQIVI